MNREILFRGKRLDNGEWVFGDLLTQYPYHKGLTIVESGVLHEVDPETVGQYTGLKDNGKKIFEGDVLYDDYWEVYGVVVFDGGGFRVNLCNLSEDLFEFTDCPIVGNKWDNPELLEVLGDE